MKFKKVSLCLSLLLVSFACAACGSEESSVTNFEPEQQVTQDAGIVEEVEEIIDANEASSMNESAYAPDLFEKMRDMGDLDGQIIDMKYANRNLYVCTSDKVYSYGYGGFEEVMSTTKAIDSFALVGDTTFILKNSDDSHSVYCQYFESMGADPTYKEIEGIDLENVVYAMDSANSNSYILIKEYEDGYYVDKYELDSNKTITSQELKIPLQINLGGNTIGDTGYVSNIKKISYNEKDNKLFFTLSDGKVYDTGMSISFSDKDTFITISTNTEMELLDNVEKIYGYGSSLTYRRPLFESAGDKNNLYTYNSEAELVGTPDEQYKITIPLPEGYTTDDIKNIIFDSDLIIEFNDNSIYVSEEGDLGQLLYHESLSSLNNNGKIQKFSFRSLNAIALMDDKSIYELDI